MADSLLNNKWLHDGSSKALAYYIANGSSTHGMPAWAVGYLPDVTILATRN